MINLSNINSLMLNDVYLITLSMNDNEIWRRKNELSYATDKNRITIYNTIGYKPYTRLLSNGETTSIRKATISFNNPEGFDNGVLLENPFTGKDTSNGLAISFWLIPSETISGKSYDYTSIITAVSEDGQQEVKFDLEGTRQLSTINGPKLNYWEAEIELNAGTRYFITLVVGNTGLEYYVNGVNIGHTGFAETSHANRIEAAMALFAQEGTSLYAGGTVNLDSNMQSISIHKVPQNTIMQDIVGYVGKVDAALAATFYQNALNSISNELEYNIEPQESGEVAAIGFSSVGNSCTTGFIPAKQGQLIIIKGISHDNNWDERLTIYDLNNKLISYKDISNTDTEIRIELNENFGTDFNAIRFCVGYIDENTIVYVI